ncbi:NACHT domain-containing protein [Actinoplanes lobatus]|uniref:Tetratricopeptide (TPR) repeat protein n=1 Tax=Actinoplanes lobatus TaxID=113568 RepID=A0A7W7HPC0_9ACTN|nr:NACHT domain-containing protein [Actinoplanes lobatus]MBB4754212.1 tetratricopeptide (TPR) repeat protein [Actinoplanes lobatus]
MRPSPIAALLAGVALALAGNMATNTVNPPDSWWWWPWAVWSAVAALVAAVVWIERARHRAGPGPDLDRVAADLLAPIENAWAGEAVRREVTRPAPVLVRWSSTGRPAAGRQAVLGSAAAGDWREFPLTGRTDELNTEIVAAFRALPRRQLVVLGEPGAGKSVFALLLTLGLLRTRTAGEQIPLLVPISEWDPAGPLDDLLARRLAEDHRPVLGRHGDPLTVARRLVEQNRVLPLLDGLDELPGPAIGPALRALDDHASAGRPLVLTSRIGEYERAGHILTTAAVVELEAVDVDAAVAYLSYPESGRSRWERVFTHLRAADDRDPLVRTLSTPLMVSLARTAYQEPGADPAELLALGSRPEIAGRLMDAFLTAAYPGARRRRWLSCLAYHLYAAYTRDVRWWQLDPGLLAALPQRARRRTTVAVAAAVGTVGGVLAAAAGFSVQVAVAGAIAGFLCGAFGWLRVIFPGEHEGVVRLRKPLKVSLVYGLGGGYLIGLMTAYNAAALLAGLAATVLAYVWITLRGPTKLREAGPTVTAVGHALAAGSVFAATAAATGTPPVPVGVTAALLYGSTAAFAAGGWTWVCWRLAHARLAVQGWLPWRLDHFLAEAYRHGVLRRSGAIHQFRHVLLQEHLSDPMHLGVLRARAAAGDVAAARTLAELLADRGDLDGAIGVLRGFADRDASAADRLVDLLVLGERTGELRARAEAGDANADHWLLVVLLRQGGGVDEVRARADAGDRDAAVALALFLVEQGDLGALRARSDGGDRVASRHLADALARGGEVDEAIRILRDLAPNDRHAARLAAGLLTDRGAEEEALELLLPLLDGAGDVIATLQWAPILAKQQRVDELRALVDAGDLHVGPWLAKVLCEQGRLDELRERADADEVGAARWLAELLARQGREDELRARSALGDVQAALRLAGLLAERGRAGEAIDLLRPWASGLDAEPAGRLADLLAERGDVEEAIGLLRPRADRGDLSVARRLAGLLARRGDVDQAIRYLRPLADAGDEDAAASLAELRRTDQP